MENDPYSAHDALTDIDSSNAAIADRLITPWWYHPALGVGFGGMCLAASGTF